MGKKLTDAIKKILSDESYLSEEYLAKNRAKADLASEIGVSTATLQRALSKLKIMKTQDQRKELRAKGMLNKYGVSSPMLSEEIRLKVENTNLKRYGVKKPFQSEAVRNKAKATMLDRHGVDRPFDGEKFRAKAKATMLDRHGVEHPMQNVDIREKHRLTMLDKYGKENGFQVEEFKEKSAKTMIERYGEDNPSKVEELKERKIIGSMIKFGTKNPSQSPQVKSKVINTKVKLGLISTIEGRTLSSIASEYDLKYSALHYYFSTYDIKKIKELVNTVRLSADKYTYIEQIIKREVGIEKFNKKALKSYGYRPDFKLTEDLYLNVDGLYWHSEAQVGRRYHFDMRDSYELSGKRIIQIREDELNFKLPIVKSIINNSAGNIKNKIFARKTNVRSVTQTVAADFLIANHMMASLTARHLGLYLDGELISLFSYKIFKGSIMKIERFCSKIDYVVVGGLSKLLVNAERIHNPEEVQSWVDLRYGNGNSLKLLGFKKQRDTQGWKWTDGKRTYNRLRCRANMDDRKLTEREHSIDLGWYRIYDAGQRLYSKK